MHSPLSIRGLRQRKFETDLTERGHILGEEGSFHSFLAEYLSDGLKVFARVNIPVGDIPKNGFPAVVFAHGFSPEPYAPNYFERPYYEAWTSAYARAGFAVLMPGYRGHGVIDGEKAAGLEFFREYSPLHLATSFYAVDVLYLLAGLSPLKLPQFGMYKANLIDPANLFLAAHSMGGDVAMKVLAATGKFRAASIWAGVCASIEDVAAFYAKYEIEESKSEKTLETAIHEVNEKIQRAVSAEPFLLEKASETNGFFYLENITAPVILHQGMGDYAIDPNWSVALNEKLQKLGKDSTLHLYEGNDHELSLNDEHHLAIERDVAFFKDHLKKEK